jgi:two-component system response regulator YesN
MTKNLLEMFLIKLCRNTDVLTKKMRRNYVIDGVEVPYNVKEILDILHQNVYNKISIKEISAILGKSESSVKKLFAEYHGIMKYYNSLKIKEAKKLIREERYNLSQIADMLCFDNQQYFSKCFKKYTKMTPSEYKKSILKN